MTIRNKDHFMAALWDWGFLDKCFGSTKIRVSDLDGIVERNGWFLVIEAKSPGAPIPTGQWRMFEALAAKGFSVLILWGEPNKTERLQIWFPNQKEPQRSQKATDADAQNIVSRWFEWANSSPNGCGQ